MADMVDIYYKTTHVGIAKVTNTFFSRLIGLLGKKGIPEDKGLLLYPVSSIHTYGMQFPIDVIFLDKEKTVLEIVRNMQPGNNKKVSNAYYVIEVKAGRLRECRLQVGYKLEFKEGG